MRIGILLAFLTGARSGFAQSDPPDDGGQPPPAAEREPDIPADAFGRETPRGSVSGFFAAAEEGDFERAAEYVDLRFLPLEHRGTRPDVLARKLYIVLQRALWVDLGSISKRPEGVTGDGLRTNRDEFGRIDRDDRDVVLILDHMAGADGAEIWVISSGTVAQVLGLYDEFAYGPFVESLAEALPDVSFLGVELFKWVIGIGTVLLVYLVLLPVTWLVARLACPRRSTLYPQIRRLLAGPVAAMVAVLAGHAVILQLGVGQAGRRAAQAQTLIMIFAVWIIFALLNVFVAAVGNRLRAKDRQAAVVLLRPIATFLKIVVLIGAILIWLDNAGFNITTLLAGLGIGGVAVALALQKPLEDLFGALTLYTQQAVRLNDFCRFGDRIGTVEEIGLRTTRVRTLADTVVSLPNAKFASEYIENISARQKIRYHTMVRLRLDTTPEQLDEILEKTRALLTSHASVVPDSGRARFKELGEFALVIEVHVYVATTDYLEYLRVGEELNLGIVGIVAAAGARFAIPLDRLGSPTPPA
jgi:MscS family membrane protein